MNMYVSNLGYHVTGDDLKALFEQFGAVSSAKIVTDRETGRSRGFGFVEMDSEEESKQAIEKLNGKDLEGRSLSVTQARDKAPRSNSRW